MEKHRGSPRPAVKDKGDRAALPGGRIGKVGDRVDRCGRLVLLIDQFKALGNRTVVERAPGERNRMPGLDMSRRALRLGRFVVGDSDPGADHEPKPGAYKSKPN